MKRTFAALEKESPIDFTKEVDARDFISVHLAALTEEQKRIVTAWANGKSIKEMADERCLSHRSMQRQLASAIRKLRRQAGSGAAATIAEL